LYRFKNALLERKTKMKFKKLDARGFSHHFVMALVVLIVAIGGVYYLVASHADSATSLYLSPANQTVTAGSDVVVSLDMNTGGDPIGRIQSVLTYSPTNFKIVSITPSIASNFTSTPLGSGSVQLTENPATPANGTNLTVATITLQALASGTSAISLSSVCPDGNYYGSTCSAIYGPSTTIPTDNELGSVVDANYIVNSAPTVPAPPTNLTATIVGSTQINLNWTPSPNPTATVAGYYLYRYSPNVGTSTTFLDATINNPNATSFSVTGLEAGSAYSFYLKAFSVGSPPLVSASSNVVLAAIPSPPVSTPPPAPGSSYTYIGKATPANSNEIIDAYACVNKLTNSKWSTTAIYEMSSSYKQPSGFNWTATLANYSTTPVVNNISLSQNFNDATIPTATIDILTDPQGSNPLTFSYKSTLNGSTTTSGTIASGIHPVNLVSCVP
jgi:hypothetical protein